MLWRRMLSAFVVAGALATPARAQEPEQSWAITGATLIDGTGAPPAAAAVIVGLGDRIVCVGTALTCPIPAGAGTTDATGKWIIPGLIDTHVHLNWANRPGDARRDQRLRFAFGVTSTRDAGTPRTLPENLSARIPASSATQPEPRLVVSGLVSREHLQRYGGGDVSGLVRALAALGVDAIKVKERRNDAELHAIVAAAHAAGLPVFGHTWWEQSHLAGALAAGFDGVSHMTTIAAYARREDPTRPPAPEGIQFWVWNLELWNYQDAAQQQAAIDAIVENGTWFEPMLVTEEHFTFSYPLTDDLAYLGPVPSLKAVVRPWIPLGDSGWPQAAKRRRRIAAVYERMCEFVGRFHAAGGMLITGTDDEQPGPALLEEVRLLTRCGLSPMEGLQAATANAAVALERGRDLGTVTVGKLADLVVLDADPLRDPSNLKRIWRVVKGGHAYNPADLLAPSMAAYNRETRKTYGVRALAGASIVFVTGGVFRIVRRRGDRREQPVGRM